MECSIINNPVYQHHIKLYGDYLQTMGFAQKSVIGMPRLMKEVFEYMETKPIYDLEAIKKADIEAFMGFLTTRPNRHIGKDFLAVAHKKKYHQAIQCFNKYLLATDQAGINAPIKSNLPTIHKKITVLSQSEIQTLYQTCDLSSPYGIRDRAILSLFYGCGLRRSEGVGLDIEDIKLSHKLVHVRKGKGRKERYVPMNKAVIQDLERYIYEARPTFITHADRTKTALLLSQRGVRANGETLNLRLQLLQKNCDDPILKAKELALHLLRHSIATHLLAQGMSVKRIGQFMGHASLDSTQIYTHLNHGKFY